MTEIDDDGGFLITGGTVVTVDSKNRVIEDGAVLVKNDRIADIGNVSDFKNRFSGKTLDASGCIVMPGLVNAHTHLPMSLFRGLADDLPLQVWLNDHMFPAEAAHIRPETVFQGTLLSCAEMLLSGTTCVCDGYFFEDSVADAVVKSGMRAVLAQGVIDYPAPGVPDPSKNVDEAIRFVTAWKDRNKRISPSIFCHSPYTCSPETLIRAKKTASEHGILYQIHVAETGEERQQSIARTGLSPVAFIESLGILDEQTLLVHSVAVDQNDLEIIKKTGACVVHAPESNMKLASGIAPVPDMLDMKIPVGLGTDGCASNNDLDMFGEMGSAARLHKAVTRDPTVMDARTMLHMATLGGAKILGLEKDIGSLEKGKKADLIILDTQKPHLTPMYSPLSHLVYSAKATDVRDVFIDGRRVVQDGKVMTFHVEQVMKDVVSLSKMIGNRL